MKTNTTMLNAKIEKKKGALNFPFWKVGWLLIALFWTGSVNAQNFSFTNCADQSTFVPYAGTTSIYQINMAVTATYYCSFYLQENGTNLLVENGDFAYDDPVGGINWTGQYNGFTTNNQNVAQTYTLYLDARKKPYQLTATAPTGISVGITQTPQGAITQGTPVNLEATVDILGMPGVTATTYTWYRNGVEIPGANTQTLTGEIPPANGTTYRVTVGFSDDSNKSSDGIRILFADACNTSFSISGANGTICALDECTTVYEVNVNNLSAYYALFNIQENSANLPQGAFQIDALPANVVWNNGFVYNGNTTGNVTFYLNTRTSPYTVTTTEPAPDPTYVKIGLTPLGVTFINDGDQVPLAADICPVGNYTYEWYKNGVKVDETTTPNYMVTPSNGDKYYVVVNGKVSNETRIFFNSAQNDGIYQIPPREGSPNYTTLALDACKTIYRFDMTLTNTYYIRFAITENGSLITDLNLNVAGLAWATDGAGELEGRPANVSQMTLYLDTNTTPYTLSTTEPTPPTAPRAKIRAAGNTSISKCDPIPALTATVCPDETGAYTHYQWYKNGVAMDPNDNPTATASQLENDVPTNDGTQYYVKASNGVDTIQSNPITITFAANPVLPDTITGPAGFELNTYEHEIVEGDSIQIKTREIDNLNYTFQYRSLEVGSVWKDTIVTPKSDGDSIAYTITPIEGAEYRIKAVDAGGCVERYSKSYLVRVKFECMGEDGGVLFSEDFGHFTDATTYVYGGTTYTGNIKGASIENFWASDPTASTSNTFTPDGHVKNHEYAIYDPNGYDWCPTKVNGKAYRVEDGYYAIVSNPSSGDCGNGDYWNGTDHTGGTNGGMLFVNVQNNGEGIVVYQRPIIVNCANAKVMFSAYVSNATIKGATPVNVRLDIWKGIEDPANQGQYIIAPGQTAPVHSISSGDVLKRNQGDPNMWANLSFRFDALSNDGIYILQLTNNAPGGSGNDILLDDISVTLCYPSVKMQVDGKDTVDVVSCAKDSYYQLCAKPIDKNKNEVNIEDYIPNPYYAFQIQLAGSTGWQMLKEGQDSIFFKQNCIGLQLNDKNKGKNSVAVVVASDPQIIRDLMANPNLQRSCDTIFATDTITINYSYFEPKPIDTTLCPGQVPDIPEHPDGNYTWELRDTTGIVIKDDKGSVAGDQSDLKERYEEYFKGDTIEQDSIRQYIFYVKTGLCEYPVPGGITDGSLITIIRSPEAGILLSDITNSNVDASLFDISRDSKDTLKICERDVNIVEIELALDKGYKGDTTSFSWIWEVKVDSNTIVPVKIDNLAPFDKTRITMKEVADLGIYQGVILAHAKCLCTDTVWIPFKIYRNYELQLTSDVPAGGLCLDADSKNVTLTAATDPYLGGEPIRYYWFQYDSGTSQFVQLTGNPTSDSIKTIPITANGNYQFKVEALDSVCHKAVGEDWANTNQTSFVAGKPMTIKMLPLDPDSVCGTITFDARVTNPRADSSAVWSTPDKSSMVSSTSLPGTNPDNEDIHYNMTQAPGTYTMYVSISDEICPANTQTIDSVDYTILPQIGSVALTSSASSVCIDPATAGTATTLTAATEGVTPIEYIWYYKKNEADAFVEKYRVKGTGTTAMFGVDSLLTAGSNIFEVAALGCDTVVDLITITASDQLKMSLSVMPDSVVCPGESLTFKASVDNPVQGTQYSWSIGGTVDPSSTAAAYTYEIPNITSGGQVTVTVSNTICSATKIQTYSLAATSIDPPVFVEQGDTVCIPATAASIDTTLHLLPVSGAKKYTWYDASGHVLAEGVSMTSLNVTLTAGTNQFRVDVTGCDPDRPSTNTITFIARTAMTLALNPKTGLDFCSEQTITFNATLGNMLTGETVSEYYWELVNSGTATPQAGTTNSNGIKLESGTTGWVKVYVNDAVCHTQPADSAQYNVAKPIEIKLKAFDSKGNQIADGAKVCEDNISLELEAAGDTTGYTWEYNGIPSDYQTSWTETLNSGAKTITVVAKAPNGNCPVSASITITGKDDFDVEITGDITVTADGRKYKTVCVGSDPFELNATTNSSAAVTSYTWTSSMSQANPTAGVTTVYTPARAGEDVVVLTANTGVSACNNTDTVFVTIQEPPVITLKAVDSNGNPVADNASICEDQVSLSTEVAGDTTGYTWTYNGVLDDYRVTSWTENLDSNYKTFTVKATGVCEASASITIKGKEHFTVEITGDNFTTTADGHKQKNVCIGSASFDLGATTNPSSVAIDSYTWTSSMSQIDPATGEYTPTEAGKDVVVLTATSSSGCNVTDTLYVNIQQPAVITLTAENGYRTCVEKAEPVTLVASLISGSPDSIYWSGQPPMPYSESNMTRTVTPQRDVQYYSVYVSDAVCGNSDVETDSVRVTLISDARIDLIPTPSAGEIGDTIKLVALQPNGLLSDQYTWFVNDAFMNETAGNETSYIIEDENDLTFRVETNIGDCPVSAEADVEVISIIPNIITPYNKNGKNDVFMGPKNGKPGYKVEIYNRYQQMIFEGNNGWDGKYRGKTADPGTYFYRLFLRNGKVLKGTLEVAKF